MGNFFSYLISYKHPDHLKWLNEYDNERRLSLSQKILNVHSERIPIFIYPYHSSSYRLNDKKYIVGRDTLLLDFSLDIAKRLLSNSNDFNSKNESEPIKNSNSFDSGTTLRKRNKETNMKLVLYEPNTIHIRFFILGDFNYIPLSGSIGELYETRKDHDGFLYLYFLENN